MSGMEPMLLAQMLIGGATTVAGSMAASDADDERRAIANRQLERNNKATDKNIELVQAQAEKMSPQGKRAAMAAEAAKAESRTTNDLKVGAGGGNAGDVETVGDAGNVSSDFLQAKAGRAVEEGNRLTEIAREMSRGRANNLSNNKQNISMSNLASDLQNLWGTERNMSNASGRDVSAVREPAYGDVARLAGNVGGAYLGSRKKDPQTGQINWGI